MGYSSLENPNYRNFSYILAVYNDKEKKETEYEVISEEEPSVVEFKNGCKMFQTILILKSAESLLSF